MLRAVVIAVTAYHGIAFDDVALAIADAAPRSFAGFAALQQHVTPRTRTRRENDHHGVYAECDDLKACTAAVGDVNVASMEFRNSSDLQIACLTTGVEPQYADACAAWRKCLVIGPSAVIPIGSFHSFIRHKQTPDFTAEGMASTAYTSLGIQVEGPTLGQNYSVITHISNTSGLIRQWNDATGSTLRVGDMIIAVNGSSSALRPYLTHRIPRLPAVNITVRRDVTEAILDILYASREDQSGAQLEQASLQPAVRPAGQTAVRKMITDDSDDDDAELASKAKAKAPPKSNVPVARKKSAKKMIIEDSDASDEEPAPKAALKTFSGTPVGTSKNESEFVNLAGELVRRDGTEASGDCLHPSVEDPEFLLCDCFTGMQRKCHAPGVHDVANYTDADCFRALFCMMDRVCEPWKAQSCNADQTKMLMAGIIQGALREHIIQ